MTEEEMDFLSNLDWPGALVCLGILVVIGVIGYWFFKD